MATTRRQGWEREERKGPAWSLSRWIIASFFFFFSLNTLFEIPDRLFPSWGVCYTIEARAPCSFPLTFLHSHTHSLFNLTIICFCLAIDFVFSLLLVTPTQVWLHLRLTGKKYQIDYDSLLARLGGWRASWGRPDTQTISIRTHQTSENWKSRENGVATWTSQWISGFQSR